MKKTKLNVLTTMAVIFIGVGSLAWGREAPKDISNPGITVVHDEEGDISLVYCNESDDDPCTVPSDVGVVPLSTDIVVTRITEVGRDQVDLSITPAVAITLPPSVNYIAYSWQFPGDCSDDSLEAIVVTWQGEEGEWSASMVRTPDCNVPDVKESTLIEEAKITFEEGGVTLRLPSYVFPNEFNWYAAVSLSDHTLPVDVAPDVMGESPELPATWESR